MLRNKGGTECLDKTRREEIKESLLTVVTKEKKDNRKRFGVLCVIPSTVKIQHKINTDLLSWNL